MLQKKPLRTRRALASAPAGKLSFDGTVALRHKQARRPPAIAGSNRPVILLAENRDSTRVALNRVLEAAGYDVIDVERASDALSIGVTYDGHIDFLITSAIPLRQSRRGLDLLGADQKLDQKLDQKIAVLVQPVRLDVFANEVSEMIKTRQSIQ